MTDPLEKFWEDILSGDAKRTRRAYAELSIDQQSSVIEHLRRMVSEMGWQPEQTKSAQIALLALGETIDPSETFFMRRPPKDE